MISGFVTVEKQNDIAIVRFDRGDKRNAFTLDIMEDLIGVANEFHDDCETKAGNLTGAENSFSAGDDLTDSKRWNCSRNRPHSDARPSNAGKG